MIENIDKPALSALWPNKKGMSVVLDLVQILNVVQKIYLIFQLWVHLYINHYILNEIPNVALLNIGSEELKGNEIIKETFKIIK